MILKLTCFSNEFSWACYLLQSVWREIKVSAKILFFQTISIVVNIIGCLVTFVRNKKCFISSTPGEEPHYITLQYTTTWMIQGEWKTEKKYLICSTGCLIKKLFRFFNEWKHERVVPFGSPCTKKNLFLDDTLYYTVSMKLHLWWLFIYLFSSNRWVDNIILVWVQQ